MQSGLLLNDPDQMVGSAHPTKCGCGCRFCGSRRLPVCLQETFQDPEFGEQDNRDDDVFMRFFIVFAAAGVLCATALAELPRGNTKPRTVCGIPDYPYSSSTAAKPTTTAATLVRVPANKLAGATGVGPQVYQLNTLRMQSDHCYLSRVAAAFDESGGYTISFRADQNPVVSDDPASPLRADDPTPRWTLQTSQLLRNQFLVTVRGYANDLVDANPLKLAAPKPVLVEFKLDPFWVERGKPYSGKVSGTSDAVRKNFAFIDRLEVEFSYK